MILTLSGGGFASGAIVTWNGSALAASFVSSTRLTASFPAGLLNVPVYAGVQVINPSGAISNLFPFTVQPSFSALSVIDISPGAALAGSGDISVTITGSGFNADSSASLDGVAQLGSSVLSETQMTVTIPASLLAMARTASLRVTSGGTGYDFPFTVRSN